MKKICLILSFMGLLILGVANSADAKIVNFGVDVYSDGTNSLPSTAFFNADTDGYLLHGGGGASSIYSLTLDTASVFGSVPGSVTWASLFVDAKKVNDNDASDVVVQGISIGPLQNVPQGSAYVPKKKGGVKFKPSALDNTFFDLGALGVNLNDLQTDSTFTVLIKNTHPKDKTKREFRFDGLNIQAEVVTPEPASTFLLGVGLAGLFGRVKIRKEL
ncbi:PEP-CTERM sorting domain-containing protein [Candidatus Omnitrophota bacterium]